MPRKSFRKGNNRGRGDAHSFQNSENVKRGTKIPEANGEPQHISRGGPQQSVIIFQSRNHNNVSPVTNNPFKWGWFSQKPLNVYSNAWSPQIEKPTGAIPKTDNANKSQEEMWDLPPISQVKNEDEAMAEALERSLRHFQGSEEDPPVATSSNQADPWWMNRSTTASPKDGQEGEIVSSRKCKPPRKPERLILDGPSKTNYVFLDQLNEEQIELLSRSSPIFKNFFYELQFETEDPKCRNRRAIMAFNSKPVEFFRTLLNCLRYGRGFMVELSEEELATLLHIAQTYGLVQLEADCHFLLQFPRGVVA